MHLSAELTQGLAYGNPRNDGRNDGDEPRDGDDGREAAETERDRAEQRLDLVPPGVAIQALATTPARPGRTASPQAPPIAPPRRPSLQEMPLELTGDVAVGRADEMQHLHDLPVAGHRAARREGDRQRGRRDDQPDDAMPSTTSVLAMAARRSTQSRWSSRLAPRTVSDRLLRSAA